MEINKSYMKKLISDYEKIQYDIDKEARLHAGKNLYDKAQNSNKELVISSIVAREDIPDDLILYIYYCIEPSLEEALDIYKQLVFETKIKVELLKNEIVNYPALKGGACKSYAFRD